MSLAVFLAIVAPAVLIPLVGSGAGRYLADRLRPAWSVWLLTGALAGFAAVTVFGIALLLGLGIPSWNPAAVGATWSLVGWVGGSRPAVTAPLLGEGLAVLAGVLGLVVLVRTVRALREIVGQYRGARALVPPGAQRWSVIETDGVGVTAQALPVRGGHVLVETRAWTDLPPRHRDVVLAHERSHLRHRHDLHLVVAALAVACNPLVAPLSRAQSYAVERWADEDATVVGDRRSVARAIGAVALSRTGTTAPVLGVGGGVVPRRVGALLRPHSRWPTWGGTALALVVVGVLASSVGLAHHAWVDLLEILAAR